GPAAGRCARWRPATGRRSMGSVRAKGTSSFTDRRQRRSGVERRAPSRTGFGAPCGSGAQRWAGWADAGVAAPGALWAEPRFVSLTLGVTIVSVLTNTKVDR